jgi:hypothetical protein
MVHFPSQKRISLKKIHIEKIRISKNNIIFVEPAIQLRYSREPLGQTKKNKIKIKFIVFE